MKCKLCESYFTVDSGFSSLFKFPEVCSKCSQVYQPKLNEEIIPIEGGVITYIYLYDEVKLNLNQRNYLSRHRNIFYSYFLRNLTNFELIIELNYNTLFKANEWFFLFKPYKNILFFSLSRFELINFNIL
jgi:hypothetical protein